MKKSFITVSPDSGQNDNILNIVCDKTTLPMVYQNPYNYNLVKAMMDDIRSLGGEIIITMKSSTLDPTICICDCIINP